MKIEKLYYFETVVRHKNFTRAARACHVAQPAISKQMLSLEKDLGFPLFRKERRQVELTEAGAVFYGAVETFLREYEASLRRVEQLAAK